MKFSSLATAALGLFTGAQAYEVKVCTGKNLNGVCDTLTSIGAIKTHTTTYQSYNWRSANNICVRICDSCTSLGYRCDDWTNNSISFNKAIIFKWDGGKGPSATSCC
ncbi:hypothetical protein QBC36DRAFT_70528 [Triangularia setosa]|uniref:Uncharacterized protein n=1 Tax=Triangularia setosa TaxID=2587417 RepID=A0AAN6WFI5_9PEZI|nr:hypothetical protein QBC36DRAFT_70528 [Podospora setosa]